MQQDMIVIIDLGSEQNTLIAREIRELGVYSEIHAHDITASELAALPGV
ncbi:MAG: glutamine-hydrolyzing GMP synthase, partial [Angelakisella sp.]